MTGGACQGCMRGNERVDWHDDVNEETEYSVLLLLLLEFLSLGFLMLLLEGRSIAFSVYIADFPRLITSL